MEKTIINEMIEIGNLIWEKNLSGGMSGNISVKIDDNTVLITGRGTCLGMLKPSDICTVDLDGNPRDKNFIPSSESLFHTSVYKNLDARAVVHVHPTWSNGYFSANDRIEFDTFETRLTFGDIPVVNQKTPTITDVTPVIEALKKNNIVVLKHHGIVAIGETLLDAFFLVQTLEEAVQMAFIKDFYLSRTGAASKPILNPAMEDSGSTKKYELFSEGQIKDIVELVNRDDKFKKLSLDTALKTKLAVVLDETQTAYCFDFQDGRIAGYSHSTDDAEFVISGKAQYWRQIFNRQLDPFAATTQKKLKLKGDFAKISRWYVPFNRLFELWVKTPVE
jgi:ribulose-5-phosphate 4-epimerase/fuculose-1-phosphate aldolase/putative sterol carrier protein